MGHRGGAPLYGRMMKAIQTGHSFGNRVRMLKLPLIFLEPNLYAEAIAQFYWLSSTLELKLADHEAHPMIAKVKALNLCVTPGYESDLRELFGEGASHPIDLCIVAAYRLPKHPIIGGSSLSCTDWRRVAERKRTAATTAYVKILESADAVSLTAAAFILYGALVVGGGKMTQRKVRKVLPGCQHALFDVADDMKSARTRATRPNPMNEPLSLCASENLIHIASENSKSTRRAPRVSRPALQKHVHGDRQRAPRALCHARG